ncbi:MAG: metallophosphoesterase family protein [Thermoprotei archaeon]|nr:metallophosphoesterase family protein [TACK group archaeon]
MRLCLASDLHGCVRAASYLAKAARALGCSAIVVAGDISAWQDSGSYLRAMQELRGFGGKVVVVLGNSDRPDLLGISPSEISVLHGTCERVNGVRFVGASGVPPSSYPSWFTVSEDELSELLKRATLGCLEGGPLVSVTHVPPFGVLDRVYDGSNVGSKAVINFIREKVPALHVCGHIHEARGTALVGKTLVVNPGQLRDGEPVYVADVSGSGASVKALQPSLQSRPSTTLHFHERVSFTS